MLYLVLAVQLKMMPFERASRENPEYCLINYQWILLSVNRNFQLNNGPFLHKKIQLMKKKHLRIFRFAQSGPLVSIPRYRDFWFWNWCSIFTTFLEPPWFECTIWSFGTILCKNHISSLGTIIIIIKRKIVISRD